MFFYGKFVDISDMVGKTLTEVTGLETGGDSVHFVCSDGSKYTMYHSQDCCESVSIDDVVGSTDDLIGSPLTMAKEVSSKDAPETGDESFTWTFYKLATVKGYVDIKWYGSSNGHYSESVSFIRQSEPRRGWGE